jgi:hypothetical protein
MSKRRQHAAIIGGVVVLCGAIGITSVYIPSQAIEIQREREKVKNTSMQPVHNGNMGGTRGSMWKNMDSEIKSKKPGG